MIKINKNKIETDIEKIKLFEREKGKNFPNEYIEFLLEYNGGIPEANIFENDEVSISIQAFYGLGLSNIDDIRHKVDVLKNRIPEECLPIAEIEGGDVLCMVLSQENYGEVLLWEHEEEINEGYANNTNVFKKVSPTFNELLKEVIPFEVDGKDDFKVKDIWIDPDFLKELDS